MADSLGAVRTCARCRCSPRHPCRSCARRRPEKFCVGTAVPAAAAACGCAVAGKPVVKVGGAGEGFISEQWTLALAATESSWLSNEFVDRLTHTQTDRQTDRQAGKDKTERQADRHTHTAPPRVRRSLSPRALEVWSLRVGFARAAAGPSHGSPGRALSLTPTCCPESSSRCKEKLAALSAASRKFFRPTA